MIKTILAASSLAAALLLVGQPAKADWLCGADQCVWVTYNVVNVPAYAVTWAPRSTPTVIGSKVSSAAGNISAPKPRAIA
jgi:hypothetical protein